MRKFSQLNESKSNSLLAKLGTSEDEIKDICSELSDEGYKIDIDVVYIGLDGRIYRSDKETSEFYPCIEIELYRETDKKDGGEVKDEFNDVRNWNGGVYYEGNIGILKMIYEICHRFESTFTSKETQVYFSLRSINEIRVRITFDKAKSILPIDFSRVQDYISNNFQINDLYEITDMWSHGDGKTKYGEISLKEGTSLQKYVWSNIEKGIFDNREDLEKAYKTYFDNIFQKASEYSSDKIQVTIHPTHRGPGNNIRYNGMDLINISAQFEEKWSDELVVAKGIFRNRKEKFTIYSLNLKIEFNY